jgi:ribosome assembly protein RRB1
MSKRSHTQLQSAIDADDQPLQKTRSSGARRQSVADDMGEFEDAWEDEIEDEETAQDPTNDPDGSSTPPLDTQERLIVISSRHGG